MFRDDGALERRETALKKQMVKTGPAVSAAGDVRRFTCSQPGCTKTFVQRGSLQRHLKVHSGERPYKCNEGGCAKAFVYRHHLKEHMRTHTGEKPFSCPECFQRFAQRGTLGRHVQKHERDREVLAAPAAPPGVRADGAPPTGMDGAWALACTGAEFSRRLHAFHDARGTVIREVIVNKQPMDLHQLYLEVAKRGGYYVLSDRTAGSVGTGSDGRGKRISWMDVFRALPNYTTSETSARS